MRIGSSNKAMFRRDPRATAIAALILIVSASLAFTLTRPPSPLAAAQRLFDSLAFRALGPPVATEHNVVIVAVTEESLARLPYRSPIDRGFLADTIKALTAADVRIVGLDVLLDRPTEAGKDEALRRAIRGSRVPVVVISLAPETPVPPAQRQFLEAFTAGIRSGDANLARDRFDDVIRMHIPVHLSTGTLSFPASMAAALGASVPREPFVIDWQRGTVGRAAGGSIPVYPAEVVPLLPPNWLKGKSVLIGTMLPGTDEHRTLVSMFTRPTFGVEIHAQVLSQLLSGRTVPVSATPWLEIVMITAMAVVGVAVAGHLAGYMAAAAIGGLVLVLLAGVLGLYAWSGILIPFVPPTLAVLGAAGGIRGWQGWGERRDRQALRALFSRFVSEPVVEEIMKSRDLFLAGGRPRPQELTATVLFADVAGFTTICERMEPAPLIAWLDQYIDAMAAVVMAHDGVLLRFIGDGILAVFGVPVPRGNEAAIDTDARNAARCALEMERAMERLNDGWKATGQPEAGLRVGLHTGPLVAGSLGTGARMEFCLLGDTANTGARLEQLGKDYADDSPRYCTIVVGGPTWDRLGGQFPGLRIGDVALRGKRVAIAAYRIDSAAAATAVAVGPDSREQACTGSKVASETSSF